MVWNMNFHERVYSLVRRIPAGRVATYGQIAAMLGNPRAARAVGWAMRAAPGHMDLPCHRVIRSDGTLAPNHVFGGRQRDMLAREGITFDEHGRVRLAWHLWDGETRDRNGGS